MARNWVQHSEDIPTTGPLGGNFSVSVWSLGSLYEEYQKGRNRWSRTNLNLDLIKYFGCKIKFWRDEELDYIISYDLDTPMKTNILTHMSCHPNYLMRAKHHRVVHSRKSYRRGKPYVTVKIHPPRLMTTKWFFQRDFCPVNLFMLKATVCQFQRPWMRKGTRTACMTFYILKPSDFTNYSITADDNALQKLDANIWGTNAKIQAQHFYTPGFLNMWLQMRGGPGDKQAFTLKNLKDNSAYNSGFTTALDAQRTKEIENIKNKYKDADISDTTTAYSKYFLKNMGLYSTYILTPDRVLPYLKTAYTSFLFLYL